MRHCFDRTVTCIAQGFEAVGVQVCDLLARRDLGPGAVVASAGRQHEREQAGERCCDQLRARQGGRRIGANHRVIVARLAAGIDSCDMLPHPRRSRQRERRDRAQHPHRLNTTTRKLSILGLTVGVFAGCSWGDALDSDASAWNPPERRAELSATPLPGVGGEASGTAGNNSGVPADCATTPELDLALRQSMPSHASHRAGEPCLKGCHEAGGTAKLTLAAAGTAYDVQGERSVAEAGRQVRGIGGSVLEVDACGNFYAIADVLRTAPESTQPWVKEPTFRRMEKPLLRVARPGDCNQSMCHDFSGRLNAGIYF